MIPWVSRHVHRVYGSHKYLVQLFMYTVRAPLIRLAKLGLRVLAVRRHTEGSLLHLGCAGSAIEPPAVLYEELGLVRLAVVASVGHGFTSGIELLRRLKSDSIAFKSSNTSWLTIVKPRTSM